MALEVGATKVTYEDVDFTVYGTINHTAAGDVDVELSGVYLKDSTVDLLEMLSDDTVYELTQLVLAAHGID